MCYMENPSHPPGDTSSVGLRWWCEIYWEITDIYHKEKQRSYNWSQ
jgi:hypothetical protein